MISRKMASVPKPAADFNGVWTSVRSEKLAEFLVSQGMDEKVSKLAATKEVTQEITQDGNMFTVKTGSHTKNYVIGGSGHLKDVFGNMMFWEGSELVSKPFYMNTSKGAVETRRSIVKDEMVMKMRNEKGETTRYFKRMKSAVQPVSPPEKTTQPVKPPTIESAPTTKTTC
uniref:Uncharacterized protein n=1 Tax=Lotharella oceanica TaxID=641309 RepID=A0A7S2XHM7_9EUKA